MTRLTFRALVARMLTDGAFRSEAIVLGPEHVLSARAPRLARELIESAGAAARAALVADLLDTPPDEPRQRGGAGREIVVPADAVADDTEISIPPDAVALNTEITVAPPTSSPSTSTASAAGGAGRTETLLAGFATMRALVRARPELLRRPRRPASPVGITPIPIPGAARARVGAALAARVAAAVPLAVTLEVASRALRGAGGELTAVGRALGTPLGEELARLGGRLTDGAAALPPIARTADGGDPGGAVAAAGRAVATLARAAASCVDALGERTDVAVLAHANDALAIAAAELTSFTDGLGDHVTRAISSELSRTGELGRSGAIAAAVAASLGELVGELEGGLGLAIAASVDGVSAVAEAAAAFTVGVLAAGGDPATGVDGGGGRDSDDGGGLGASTIGRTALALAAVIAGPLAAASPATGRVRVRDRAALQPRAAAPSPAELRRAATDVLTLVSRRTEPGA
jgi:hypothetical protein